MTAILEVREIVTRYGQSQVLHGVSLVVGQGEVVSLLGRNGVGKTTTFRSIMGLTPPRSGSILMKGTGARRPETLRDRQAGDRLCPR